MRLTDFRGTRSAMLAGVIATLAVSGCHSEETHDWSPLATQKIYVADRFYDVEVLSPEHVLVVGYKGKLLETKDGGGTWDTIDLGTKNALFSIDFANESVGWIVGQEAEILKTTDGGKTWEKQGGHIYMGEDCRDEGDDRDEDCNLAPLFAMSVVDVNTVIAVGDRSTVTMTTDGGRTWKTTTLTWEGLDQLDINSQLAFEDPVLYDVHFKTPLEGFVVGEFGKIFHTSDGGATWFERQASLVGEDYFDVLDLPTFFDVEFLTPETGYAVGLEGRIAKTVDAGLTWTWKPNNVDAYDAPMHSAAILPNGTVWVVGASGQVVKAPPGQPFEDVSFGSAVNNWIREIVFFDDKHGWVVGGFGFIMSTEDGGETWFRRIG